jgi:iron complex outermembrane receptor protein
MAMRMVNLAGDGNGYVGNLELEPEIAHTLSLSADWHDSDRQHWQLIITPFVTEVDDYVDAAPCTAMMCASANMMPGFRYLTFANNDARLYGIDISGFRHLAVMEGVGSFVLRALINYVDGENSTSGDNLYNIMPLNATISLEHSNGNWTNTAEIHLVSAKDDTAAVRNEVETPGYALLNLRSSFSWQHIRVDMGIENSLDQQYDLPLGGAYVGQGKTMAATDVPWGIAVPGMGRSVYLGVNYRF